MQEFFVICQTCAKRYTFLIDPEDYYAFRHGTFAQDAFPYLTVSQRELMISQTCGPCFDKMFPKDDEDDFTDDQWHDLITSLGQMARGELLPATTQEEDDETDGE
jgi:hypothetical protein